MAMRTMAQFGPCHEQSEMFFLAVCGSRTDGLGQGGKEQLARLGAWQNLVRACPRAKLDGKRGVERGIEPRN